MSVMGDRAQDAGDLRCVACGHEAIVARAAPSDGFGCAACGAGFERVWGVPFFGCYERSDILGLIEIAANLARRGHFGVTPETVAHLDRTVRDYHAAQDKAAFVASCELAQASYFQNRYREWLEYERLTRDLNLRGRKVLDIGAGLGFDSHRLAQCGADVTALEFSPVLAESGSTSFPELRWIGGFSHCLPFRNSSFDAVFINAALHHMRDVSAAVSEALRVLRPGGVLVTTSDSFRPDGTGERVELEVFDREPAVLLGINEGIPCFSDFVSCLMKHPAHVMAELFTHTLYNAPLPYQGTLTALTRWNWPEDAAMLASRSGSVAMKVKLQSAWPEPARLQADWVLCPLEYASWLVSDAVAVARLATLLPDECVGQPFGASGDTKFSLLNGWRLAQPARAARVAYRRARWFERRSAGAAAVVLEIGLPSSSPDANGVVSVQLDGIACGQLEVRRAAWSSIVIDLSAVAVGKVFVLELQRLGDDETLDGAGFEVRPPRFRATDESRLSFGEHRSGEGRAATVFAVMPVFDRVDLTRACIGRLKSQSYAPIRIVVADGGSTDGTVEAIRSEHGDVVVLTGCRAMSWSGLMEMGIGHALRQSEGDGDCVLMMNNDTVIPDDYVETLVRAARQHDAAVGPLIVDSRDPGRILNAGVSIDWTHYEVCVKSAIGPGERYWGGVDVLPGPGSLVPLRMIHSVGNIDSKALPHHLADYEFTGRLKLRGFRLGVCYETALMAHPEEIGIASRPGPRTVALILRQAFDRRRTGNIVDHWRFVGRCAPASARLAARVKLVRNLIADLVLGTSLRPLFRPLLWLWRLPRRAARVIARQLQVHRRFAVAVAGRGVDVLCQPECFPHWAASTLYYLASPGPIRGDDCARIGLDAPSLVDRGFLRELGDGGWYALATLRFGRATDRNRLRRLFWLAWVPWRKRANARTLRRDLGPAR